MRVFFFLFKPFFGCEKSIARSRLNQNIFYTHFGHFALSNTKKKKKKIDAAHFLDARDNEKQVSNLEWPYLKDQKFCENCIIYKNVTLVKLRGKTEIFQIFRLKLSWIPGYSKL